MAAIDRRLTLGRLRRLFMPRAELSSTFALIDEAPPNLLTTGQETIPREFVTSASGVTMSSQTLRLAHFTARKTETIASVRVCSGGTAAGATPTLVRVGLYTVAANGDLTLVASTVNDTSLLAAQNTAYAKALSASYGVTRGTRYAVGLLVVTGATAPTVLGQATLIGPEAAQAPRMAASVASQADLPSTVATGALSNTGTRPYAVLLP